MNDEIIDESDIADLYELSLVNQETEERAEIMLNLAQDLALLGVSEAYLEGISQNVFKARTSDIDNDKLRYLKKLLEDRIGKLAAQGKIDIRDTEQKYI